MLTRREMICSCATAMGAAVVAVPLVAKASDWRETFRVLNFGVVSSENEADRIARYKTFVPYMERTMRAPIKMHQATDYAGTIEALKARKLEFVRFGPVAYAQAWLVTGGKVEPIVVETDNDGFVGYHAVVAVRVDSPFQTLDDLRGKSFAFAERRSAVCPNCQHRSRAVHSIYRRTVADLPLAGAKLFLHLQVRRFFCRHATCPQRIFAERFPTLVPVRGRHSLGVYSALRQVGLAVGGRAGARLARALGLPGSDRTIVRLIHCAPFPLFAAPRVIGLDEWAWRRGRRFGTIVCDLECHHVLDLLPERSASSVAQWLQAHPSVEIVCRDRSGLYAEGIRQGAPQAIQVVDRFHLVQNLHDALERFFLRYRRDLNTLGASLHQSSELTSTPAMISQARHTRWIHRYHEIQRLRAQQLGIAAIARRVQVSRPTVYRYLAMPQPPERQRSRHRGPPLVAPFIPYLRRRWNAGCRNAQQLWRELVAEGHRPSRRTVERYIGQLRRETGIRFKFRQVAPVPLYAKDHDESRPSALTALRAARLFLSKEQDRRAADQMLLAHLLRLDPVMIHTYHQVQAFCRMVRQRRGDEFDAWVAAVQHTGVKELRAFVKGLLKDEAAVRAGLSLVWSNGPTEGFIHRLKLLKGQAYGRAGVDFLRHRILAPSARKVA